MRLSQRVGRRPGGMLKLGLAQMLWRHCRDWHLLSFGRDLDVIVGRLGMWKERQGQRFEHTDFLALEIVEMCRCT
jgi:hypothetical protein